MDDYHEIYEKIEGRWQIKSSTLTRLRMDFTAPSTSEEGSPA